MSYCSGANEITYEYFCVLGGLSNKRCAKRMHKNGDYIYFTYYLVA